MYDSHIIIVVYVFEYFFFKLNVLLNLFILLKPKLSRHIRFNIGIFQSPWILEKNEQTYKIIF